MRVAVTYDSEGRILTMFDPERLRHERGEFRYVPAAGEQHSVLELPKELEGKSFLDLSRSLRVNDSDGKAVFELLREVRPE